MSAPDSALIRLDLPAPLSPITARISRGYSSRSPLSMAVTRPYLFVRPFAWMTGVTVTVVAAVMSAPPLPCPPGPRFARCSRSCLYLPDPLVERHSDQDEQADREALPDDLDAGELQAVAEHADDERTDECADHAAASAEQARATEHDGGDGVEVVLRADVGAGGREPSDENPAPDRVQQARHGVDGEKHVIGTDT